MDAYIVYTIITLVALLIAGTFFSASEMAFSALNRARVKHMVESGNKRARLVLKLHDRFDEIISTLLICNNAVAIVSATISAFLFVRLMGDIGPVVSSIAITIIIVVFTDDFPKSATKHNPEVVAVFAAPIVQVLIVIFRPINFLLVKWKARINKRLHSRKEKHGFPGEELLYVVEEAEHEGTISEDVSQRISNAIEFSDLTVEDIYTPRVNIVGVSEKSSYEDVRRTFLDNEFSRLPVYCENMDNILGIVHIKDFMICTASKTVKIKEIMSPPVYTALVTKVPDLLKIMQKEKKHIAIVADEYSGTEGLVTMDDILRQLVGDIWDEHDEVTEEIVPVGKNKYKINCAADIEKMFEFFNMKEESTSSSVGGWITDILERIPVKGDSFTYKNLDVTVTKADPKHAIECTIKVTPEETDSESTS